MTRDPESPWADAEPDEVSFLGRALDTRGWTFGEAQRCPAPEMLRAAQESVLPDDLQRLVASHVERCPVCQLLVEALDDASVAGISGDEQQRIGRVLRGKTAHADRLGLGSLWTGFWRPIPVSLVTLLVLGSVGWLVLREPAPPPSSARGGEPAAQTRATKPSVFTLEKAAVRLPAAAVILWRSDKEADSDRATRDLASAIEPYRRDEFTEAARRLTDVARQYPASAAAHFYLGVCDLFLRREVEAIAAFETAKRLASADPVLADETAWYLALAYQKTGQPEAAIRVLRPLCEAKGAWAARACAGLQELAVQPAMPEHR
jgi:hypothetical protein